MKIFAFVDVHGSSSALRSLKSKIKKSKPDLVICAGDFTLFEHDLQKILKKIDSFNVPVFLIHGNHESAKLVKSLCSKSKNIKFVHKKIVPFQNFLVLGWGGGGFSFTDKEFEKFIKPNKLKLKNKKIILITHAPPYNTKVDYLANSRMHAGNKSFTNFIKSNKNIVLAVSGHLHETKDKQDKINNAIISNPGPFGKVFKL